MCFIATRACGQTVKPWTQDVSRPFQITNGLMGHHLAVWPSHGRYYNFKTDSWMWQRTQIFGTTEDLFTQTIVIPYLIPMLERAGANVFVPRERDWQTEEVVVDNDGGTSSFMEINGSNGWKAAPRPGFGKPVQYYLDGDRPFARGTARMVTTTTVTENLAKAYYKPDITVSGPYAVYVSYQTVAGSVDDAEYVVVHQGIKTRFRVNQQMGSGTWVYLGTFDFDANDKFGNYVMVTNNSSRHGVVTTDAVRFGGGMGNHERGGRTSHLPRAMECARYYVQYAGAPKAVIVSKGGQDDYGDDINARSLMSNWLSYGSSTNPTEKATVQHPVIDVETTTIAEAAAKAYLDSIKAQNPDSVTLVHADSVAHHIADSVAKVPFQQINVMKGDVMTGRVPLELQLAVHSDAGWTRDFKSPFGTLTICTSDFNNNMLAAGASRKASFNFACDLLYGVNRDLQKAFGSWEARDVWDKNYSETRLPAQPSAILETMSHENFPDIKMGHDPNFKFVLARAVYKAILKYIAREKNEKVVVEPLAPHAFSASKMKENILTLRWTSTPDTLERSAVPDAYILYTRVGDKGYDNGKIINDTITTVALKSNTIYRFRITAINKGGESFPTEELVAMYCPESQKIALIVNAFHRLSSPAVVETDSLCGFDLDDDIGLSYGKTPAWVGHQKVFDKSQAGKNLGYTSSDLIGCFTAGNDFNYAYTHAAAIKSAGGYSIVSTASDAIADDDLNGVSVLDVVLGNEKDDNHSLVRYKTFTPEMQQFICKATKAKMKTIVSGSYLASDMKQPEEKEWLANTLHIAYAGCDRDSLPFRTDSLTDIIYYGTMPMSVYRHVNADHYASVASDVIMPTDSTATISPLLTYASGKSAAQYCTDGTSTVITLGFPFECIKLQDDRDRLMKEFLSK